MRRLWTLLGLIMLMAQVSWAGQDPATSEQQLTAALQMRPDRVRGQELFVMCEGCHGSDGRGEQDGNVPAIAGQYFRSVVSELLSFRYGARSDPAMEEIARRHDITRLGQIADVAAYVSSLPPQPALGVGDGEHLRLGADVYERVCAGCHGANAQGSAQRGVPWLASQHYAYLRREMYYVADHRRPNMDRVHWQLFRRFEADEFEGIPDYLSRLPPPSKSP